jgi:hypothetical protein
VPLSALHLHIASPKILCGFQLRSFILGPTLKLAWKFNFGSYYYNKPVPVAAQSKARTVFDRSNTGIMGSNPARGMDVCPRFCVLYYPV